MTEHPYEFGGILFTIAILGGILGGIAYDEYNGFPHGWKDVIDNGVHEMVMMQKPTSSSSSSSWTDYYQDNHNYQLDCKKSAVSLQEFYDCVNNP